MSPNDCIEARERISPYLQQTPMIKSDALEQILGYESPIYLKLECEQPTGSFKVRGAFNTLLQLDPHIEKVVAFSSGNFAQAVAFGSAKLHKKATIIMPKNAPQKKIDGTRNLGAEILFCGERHEDGELIVKELVEKEGYHALHPFNSYQTMAGQGTIALEILETNPQMKHFFSPVGGGGLLSGCATVFKAFNEAAVMYSVEPLGAHDFYESFQAKRHIAFEKTNTIADGLRAVSVGKLNYPILMSTVDKALAVTEERIIEAMRFLWKHHDLVVEPSGAVALAGFLSVHKGLQGEVVILVTGKNVDPESFTKWIEGK
ncbi:MAG: threonine/serine dehydratase [Verrucomicrobia bacterium]|nr:threonine/serine dehydratase [Verrucomicrobiota bacterium]